jgi:hypothetical protein
LELLTLFTSLDLHTATDLLAPGALLLFAGPFLYRFVFWHSILL